MDSDAIVARRPIRTLGAAADGSGLRRCRSWPRQQPPPPPAAALAADDRGWTALHVRKLLDSGAHVDEPVVGHKSPGATPLHMAAAGGHVRVMDELRSRGANIEARTKSGGCGWTPLHLAAKERSRRAMRYLLDNGAYLPPDITDTRFNPPLHYCPGLDWAYAYQQTAVRAACNGGPEDQQLIFSTQG
eukprot:SM000258S09089  [mRNA]  locus=s258:159132:160191:+ [translate_table: standard]